MLDEVYTFLKKPVYQEDPNQDFNYRLRFLIKLITLGLAISITFLIVISIVENAFKLEMGRHAMEDLFENYSVIGIFFLAVILAPLLEELFFRGPLVWFKNSKYFVFIFYLMTLLFGYVHITNFEISPLVLLLSPLLVAPQIAVGLLAGIIRVKFGLLWSIALHALYNCILITPILLMKLLDIPIE